MVDPELLELYGKVVAATQVAPTPTVPVQLPLTADEVRTIVVGARLLEVKAAQLVGWAGSVNAEERVVARWHRPYVVEGQLVRLCLLLDAGKHGASDAQIIDLLRHSRLEHVIGVARSNVVREHLTAGLTGAQFAQWRSQGVPDSVLDALQGRFIGQLVELDRLRYQNWF